MKVAIVGLGIIGLTTALELLQTLSPTLKLTVYYHQLPHEANQQMLVSQVAAASFIPHSSGRYPPSNAHERWLTDSAKRFYEHVDVPESGVRVVDGVEYFGEKTQFDPWWKNLVKDFRHGQVPSELSHLFNYRDSWCFSTPIIDTSIYLPYLLNQLSKYSDRCQLIKLTEKLIDLSVLYSEYNAVINCTGLGATKLKQCADDSVNMTPVYGLVIRVQAPFVTHWMRDDTSANKTAYIYPRVNDCILGGSKKFSATDSGNTDEIIQKEANEIIKRCSNLLPTIRDAKVLGYSQGFRPFRTKGIRLEHCMDNGVLLIHNYGHGGEGYCYSWGCAKAVASILRFQSVLPSKL